MSDITVITEGQFNELITTIQDDGGSAVVLFTAPQWCVPCRRFDSHWSRASVDPDLAGITFITVNMGENPEDTAYHWATDMFNILTVPTVIFFKKGVEATKVEGRTIIALKKELLTLG